MGELASKLAADSIPHLYAKHAQHAREGPESALRKAFLETNLAIHARGHGCGTKPSRTSATRARSEPKDY